MVGERRDADADKRHMIREGLLVARVPAGRVQPSLRGRGVVKRDLADGAEI
jgi:hypothetical protein